MTDYDSAALFSFNLKRIRNLRGLTQENLAVKCNTAKNYVSQLESAKRFPSPGMLNTLCRALEMEPAEFFRSLDHRTEEASMATEANQLYNSIRKYVDLVVEKSLDAHSHEKKKK